MAAASTEAPAARAKEELLDLLSDETLAQEVLRPEGKPTRGRVDEMVVKLERYNPTEEPVYSALLDGDWKVQYSGAFAPGLLSSPTRELALFLYGGFSLGNALSSFVDGTFGQALGFKIAEKTVRIQGGRDVDAAAKITVGGRDEVLSYSAELLPLSARRMSEEVMTVDVPGPIGKRDAPFELRRSILVTYLDEEVMVVRDESGIPEVLVRQSDAGVASSGPAPGATSSTPSEPKEDADEDDGSDDPLISEAS